MPTGLPNPVGTPADSAISGGLAGILAATVFGGPIGAAIGLGTGLISQRMRRNELDILADDYSATQQMGTRIQNQVQAAGDYVDQAFADNPEEGKAYHAQLDSVSSEAAAAQELAHHYDPSFRQAGATQLVNTGATIGAIYKDIAGRTQHFRDQQYELEKATANHYQTEFEGAQKAARDATADADYAQLLVKGDPKIENQETKLALMQMQGITPREANQGASSFSIGLFGTGFSKEIEKFAPDYNAAVKMIEDYRATKVKASTDYAAQLIATAHQQGYTFAQEGNGPVTVKSINSVIQRFDRAALPPNIGVAPGGENPPAPGSKFSDSQLPSPAAIAGQSVRAGLGDAATATGDFLEGIGIPRMDATIKQGATDVGAAIGQGAAGAGAALEKYSNDALNSYKDFISRNRRKNWKRPTNQ